MSLPLIIFWLSLSILFFSYAGFGLLVFLWNQFVPGKKPSFTDTDYPAVTIIIPAYNEGAVLKQKLANTLAIRYPSRLQIIVISDGSNDGSPDLAKEYPEIRWLHQPERQGKFAAIIRAMEFVETPIVVFSDANTLLNPECISRMSIHFSHPRTGGVAGEKRILNFKGASAVGEVEGIYWKYESFMKKQDADLYTVVGAAGELFGIRTELFQPKGHDIILDDFIISMRVCLQGFRIGYEPGAFATEPPSASLSEEAKRKIRISAGAYQSIKYLVDALNPFRHPLLSFQFISRRLLRWVFCPWMLIALLIVNIIIATKVPDNSFYYVFLFIQLFFYAIAMIGGLVIRLGRRAGMLTVPFYFLFMNYCLVRGFFRFLTKSQSA